MWFEISSDCDSSSFMYIIYTQTLEKKLAGEGTSLKLSYPGRKNEHHN